jgi:hypothetical protein
MRGLRSLPLDWPGHRFPVLLPNYTLGEEYTVRVAAGHGRLKVYVSSSSKAAASGGWTAWPRSFTGLPADVDVAMPCKQAMYFKVR